MRELICRLLGHREIPVALVDILPRPGGILPQLDGIAIFTPDPNGDHRACVRCRHVRCAHDR